MTPPVFLTLLPTASPKRLSVIHYSPSQFRPIDLSPNEDWCYKSFRKRRKEAPRLSFVTVSLYSFPHTLIYVTKPKLKSKGRDSVLIGLCFVGKIRQFKRGSGGFKSPQDNVFSLPYCVGRNPSPTLHHLDGLHFAQTVLDHLPPDLICSPPVKHLLRTNSAIWLREVHSGLNCWERWCRRWSRRVWCLLSLYDAQERAPRASLI